MENLYIEAKLEECIKHIDNTYKDMTKIRSRLLNLKPDEQQADVESHLLELYSLKEKLYDYVAQSRQFFMEYEIASLANYAEKILQALSVFKVTAADYSRFSEALSKYTNAALSRHQVDAQAAGRLMNHIRMGYYPTNLENVNHIKKSLIFPNNRINILDPCCGCGLALQELSEGINSLTYGVELDEARVEEARKRLYRIGKGSFFHSRISNEAFHLLFLNPPYMVTFNPNGFNVRDEKKFLIEALSCLMMDGILVYIIPYYRLTPDICRILCDNFTDIRVHRFTDKEFSKFRQVAVTGVRKRKEDGSLKAKELYELALHPENISSMDTIQKGCYTIPAREKDVEIFKGAIFDVEELAEQFRNSKSISCLFEKNELDTMERHPLLPFTIGQIGLIGGSGLLNGLIQCDVPHVLKGRIIKETRQDTKEPEKGKKNSVSEMTETTVNRMIFNILTVDGMKTLA